MAEWTGKDYSLLGGALAGTYADVESTKAMLARGGKEHNPLLGERPGPGAVNRAGAVAAGLGTMAALLMDPWWRRRFMGAWAGLEAGLARGNSRVVPGEGAAPESLPRNILAALPELLAGYGIGALVDEMDGDTQALVLPRGPEGGKGVTLSLSRRF